MLSSGDLSDVSPGSVSQQVKLDLFHGLDFVSSRTQIKTHSRQFCNDFQVRWAIRFLC